MRLVAGEGRQTAGAVSLRPLDLNYLRAEIGEELSAVGTCHKVAKVEHAHAL